MSITAERKTALIKEYPQGRQGHRLPRGPGGDPDRADHQPDRPFQDARQGQPFPARPPEDGLAAPLAARLRQAQGRGPLPRASSSASASAAKAILARFRARLRGRVCHDHGTAGMGPAAAPSAGRFEALGRSPGSARGTLRQRQCLAVLPLAAPGWSPPQARKKTRHVRHSTRRADVGRPQARPRDRQASPARPTAPCSPPTARPRCSPPSSPRRSRSPASTSSRSPSTTRRRPSRPAASRAATSSARAVPPRRRRWSPA